MKKVQEAIKSQPWFAKRAQKLAEKRGISLVEAEAVQMRVEENNFLYDSLPLYWLQNADACKCTQWDTCSKCQKVLNEIMSKHENYPS